MVRPGNAADESRPALGSSTIYHDFVAPDISPASARGLSFGSAAEAYERYRPGYPGELLRLVQTYAQGELANALEIGAGTGLATRLFAGSGLAVTAVEPDADMFAVLRRETVGMPVIPVLASFEELTKPQSPYDLLYAAAALHWTEPRGRWKRAGALLRPGGTFASFGGPTEIADPALRAEVGAARQSLLPSDDVPSPDGTAPDALMQWPGTELEREATFTHVEQHELPQVWQTSAAEYIGLLSTISAYLLLPPADRTAVLGQIRAVLPDCFLLSARMTVHLARFEP